MRRLCVNRIASTYGLISRSSKYTHVPVKRQFLSMLTAVVPRAREHWPLTDDGHRVYLQNIDEQQFHACMVKILGSDYTTRFDLNWTSSGPGSGAAADVNFSNIRAVLSYGSGMTLTIDHVKTCLAYDRRRW